MDIIAKIAEELKIKSTQVEAAVNLIDEGTPFPLSPVTVRKRPARSTTKSSANWAKSSSFTVRLTPAAPT